MRRFRFAAVLRSAASAKQWSEQARRLESTGFDALYVPDHLVGDRLAPMVALTAAACATTTLRVGTLVLANDFHHPAVLAKEAATLHLLSEGRLDLGLGTGWLAQDYAGSGLAFDPPGVRISRLAEAITVLKGLWSGEPLTFHGEHYRIEALRQQPSGRPRLLLGGGGRRLLELAAREADVINLASRVLPDGSGPDPADTGFAAKVDLLRTAERYDELELGTSVLQVGDARPGRSWSFAQGSAGSPQVLPGTTRDVADKLRHWRSEHDISTYVLHYDDDLDRFTPVVEELSGT
ncbi:TIGR03621 family F420-dependent LLM class oxidoreductase [Nonomuraea sp. NPDC050663]|uniref:TIGR03621 family F420-dependent LLM class oxidoreductase n=1 Tax=Nonomuraea sp. NPDC050663 TaxID=3364370 RepID=UPI0037B75A43